MILTLRRFLYSSLIISFFGSLSPSFQVKAAEIPSQKEYLVVLLHGINSSQENVLPLLPKIGQTYGALHSAEDAVQMADKIDFLTPTAINNEWFKVPDPSSYPKLIFDVMVRGHNMTDKLEGFRENLTSLRSQIKDRLTQLNLGYDRLILAGLSQGGVAAATLAFESEERVRGVVSAISLWMPCDMKKLPYTMISTNGEKDEIIPTTVLSKVEDLFDKKVKATSGKSKDKMIFKRVKFAEDTHKVSPEQLTSIVSFVDDNIFNAPPSGGKKFSPGDGDQPDPVSSSSSSSSEEESKLTEEELALLVEHFSKAFSRFAKG